MINKEYTIADVIKYCNAWLIRKKIIGEIGLIEVNAFIQNLCNEYNYYFLFEKYTLYTEADKFRYRMPEYAKTVTRLKIPDKEPPIELLSEDEGRSLKENESYGDSYPRVAWLGENTCLQDDIETLGDLLTITSTNLADSGTVQIDGFNGEEEQTDTVTITAGGDKITADRFTLITGITLSTAQTGDITITDVGGSLINITVSAGDTSDTTQYKCKYIGTTITFTSDAITENVQIYVRGYLDDVMYEEIISAWTPGVGISTATSSNNYSKIDKLYKFADSKGTITITETTDSNEILELSTTKKSYSTKILNIYPSDAVYQVRCDIVKNVPIYDSDKYHVVIPAKYVPSVLMKGMVVEFIIEETNNINLIKKFAIDYDNAKQAMKGENFNAAMNTEMKADYEYFGSPIQVGLTDDNGSYRIRW